MDIIARNGRWVVAMDWPEVHDAYKDGTPVERVLSAGGVLLGELVIVVEQALAPLVLLTLGMAATPAFTGLSRRPYDAAVIGQSVGAVLILASLVLPLDRSGAALAAVPWVFVTGQLGAESQCPLTELGRSNQHSTEVG